MYAYPGLVKALEEMLLSAVLGLAGRVKSRSAAYQVEHDVVFIEHEVAFHFLVELQHQP